MSKYVEVVKMTTAVYTEGPVSTHKADKLLRPIYFKLSQDIQEKGYAKFFSTELTNQMPQTSRVYYLSFKYSSTWFGHPHVHHQELQQLQ